jgi:uncharacterized membrane protein YphA (DoxX/SURF4 family)
MEKIIAQGRILFAIAITALGVENLVCAHVREVVLPVLPWLPPHAILGYATGIALIVPSLCVAAGIKPRPAAILLGIFLLVCVLVLLVPRAAAHPFDLSLRTVVFETLSFCAAALALARSLPHGGDSQQAAGALDKFLKPGRYLFAISSVVFGTSHFLVALLSPRSYQLGFPGVYSGRISPGRLSLPRVSALPRNGWIAWRRHSLEPCSCSGSCWCTLRES